MAKQKAPKMPMKGMPPKSMHPMPGGKMMPNAEMKKMMGKKGK